MAEEKVVKRTVAYSMIPGSNFMQYKVVKFSLEDGKVIAQEEVGTPDLKPVVLGRLIKLLHRI